MKQEFQQMNNQAQNLYCEIEEAADYFNNEIFPRMKKTAQLIQQMAANPQKLTTIKN